MKDFENFRSKTIREIRIWTWLAAVLPLTALACTVFIWTFGTDTIFKIALIIGETTMFSVAVAWWWWAIYVIRRLVDQWDVTRSSVNEVLDEIKDIKTIVKNPHDDK